jgi:alkylhydroperoxidase family enzyme
MLRLHCWCLAALVLALAILSPCSPARGADVRYFPDDTELVLTINLKQIRNCELVAADKDALDQPRAMLNRWAGGLPALKCLQDAGLDLFRDLTSISAASPRGKDVSADFLILSGDFDALKLTHRLAEVAKAKPDICQVVTRSGATLYEMRADGKHSHVALVNKNTLIAAPTSEALTGALARADGSRKSGLATGFQALLEATNDKQSISVVASGPALALLLDGAKLPNAETAVAALKASDGMLGGVTLSKDIQFRVGLYARDDDTAKKLADAGQGAVHTLRGLAKQAAGEDKNLLPLVEIVNSFRVKSQGPVVVLDGGATLDVIEKLMGSLPVRQTEAGPEGLAAHVPVLTDGEAWKSMPPTEEGAGQPLPAWIRALAWSLPKTAAAMIELDYAQRAESPLPERLRAKLRWVAADANRCEYAKAYARADYVRAGGRAEDIDDLPRQLGQLPEEERLALQLVRQLVLEAYSVTDAQVKRLVQLYGERQVVAIVLVAAYANFQDRLLLALGTPVEKDGPLPPVKVRFRKRPPPTKPADPPKEPAGDKSAEAPRRNLSPPAKNPPPVPEKVDDPEWTAVSFDSLRERLKYQIARRQARVHVPDWETVRDGLPEGLPKPEKPTRIRWSLVTMGYQPRLSAAWTGGLRAFHQDSDLDPVFHESMFWVVTRSLQCFY